MSIYSDTIRIIAAKVGKYHLIKTLTKPFYSAFMRALSSNNSKVFRKNALSVLESFNNAMEQNNHSYVLIFGSLLGAIREKGFIKFDLDIDVAMWAKDWSPKLQDDLIAAGFALKHTFLVDDGLSGREETYVKDGVGIDIFYFYPALDTLPYCCDFLCHKDAPTFESSMKTHAGLIARRIELPINKERMVVQFETLRLYAPKNASEILEYRYGSDYMIPNPKWEITSFDNHIRVWEDKQGIYIRYV